ncbi:MAG: tRNA (guanosine(46)-N7)-methyltransferase TrmB [Bacilli bacterium]|jgi:tRNA (guanine-N7-)-methyltransferase|nr:tRNA (guanosine(46)-N7)-methyltransferase TrmB [Acholeplasmataceae bacterium]
MRRRNIKNACERIMQHEDLMIFDPTAVKGNWQKVFGNDFPIHLEIGMGKGKFLLEQAMRNPNVNFIGIEKYESVIVVSLDKMAPYKPTNLKVIAMDATNIMEVFSEGEVAKIYLNFSDPWPKKGHTKRRLTSPKFLEIYRTILTNEGEIELKTDNKRFFEYSVLSLFENNWRFCDFSVDLHDGRTDIVTTEYEEKFKAKGMPIYYLKVQKKG